MRTKLSGREIARVIFIGGVMLMSAGLPAFAQVTHEIIVESNQAPALVSNAGSDIQSSATPDVIVGATPAATGGTAPYLYLWEPETSLSNSLVANPTLTLHTASTSYTLTVTDANGCISSDEVLIQIVITSIEKSNSSFYNIYPNPAYEYLIIEALTQNATYKLYDQDGKLLREEKLVQGENRVVIASLAKGTYFLKVTAGNQKQSSKIIIK